MKQRPSTGDRDEGWSRLTLTPAGSGKGFAAAGLASFLAAQSAGTRVGHTTTAEMSKLVSSRIAGADAAKPAPNSLNAVTAAWCGLTPVKDDGTPQFVSPEAMERVLGDSELAIFDEQGRRSKAFLVIEKST